MRVESVVVVVRMQSGDQLIGVIVSEQDKKITLEHPHHVNFNVMNSTVEMIPYCPLSDEKFFVFPKAEVLHIVTASVEVADRFFQAVDVLEARRVAGQLHYDTVADKLQAMVSRKVYVEGNSTRH